MTGLGGGKDGSRDLWVKLCENTVLSGRTLRIMLPVCSVKMTIYSLNFEIPEMV